MEHFHSDKPISEQPEDKFQRYNFSKRIAEIIDGQRNGKSIVLGIYGKWGEGKSSVLNFISKELKTETVQIRFNPWYFQDEAQLIRSFFKSIASELGKKLTSQKEDIFKTIETYSNSLATISPWYIRAVINLSNDFVKGKSKDTLEDLRNKIEKYIIDANAQIVIFIDDIDRLNINEIQAVFKLVKLGGDFPRISYILAFDNEIVASALGHEFGNRKTQDGYDFLEKIVQIPLQLPKAHKSALRKYTLELLNEALDQHAVKLTDDEVKAFLSKFDEAFVLELKNPRIGLRVANAIAFSIPLLHKEVNMSDLLTIECIKVFYPELYYFIRQNPGIFLNSYDRNHSYGRRTAAEEKEYVKSELNTVLANYAPPHREKIINMLSGLFPQLSSLFRNQYFGDRIWANWYREKRICSTYYFERYFSYVVLEGEISDIYFDELLSEISQHTSEAIAKRLHEELQKLNVNDFLFKLRLRVPDLSQALIRTLVVPFAMIGSSFPEVEGFAFTTPTRDAAFIIKEMLKSINKNELKDVVIEVLEQADPYNFALTIYDRLTYISDQQPETPFIKDERTLQLLSTTMMKRFESHAQRTHFSSLPDIDLAPTFAIYDRAGEQRRITELLTTELLSGQQSQRIIEIFSPTITSSNHPKPFKAPMREDDYEFMRKFIDPKTVYESSIRSYGNLYENAQTPEEGSPLVNSFQLIGLFQKLHIKLTGPTPLSEL